MKNLKVMIAFILGLILSGGIVYAAVSAKQINYTREDTEIKSVEDALNDLYNKQTHTYKNMITGGNNRNDGITSHKIEYDNDKALIITSQVGLRYAINSTDSFANSYSSVGYLEDNRGLYYTYISLKAGDTIYLQRDTGGKWGYMIFY